MSLFTVEQGRLLQQEVRMAVVSFDAESRIPGA